MRTVIYLPTEASPQDLDQLRRYVQQELTRISEGLQRDLDEIGDSAHGTTLETGMLLWVNRAGTLTLNRVSVGIADSGGVGYRLLRVVN